MASAERFSLKKIVFCEHRSARLMVIGNVKLVLEKDKLDLTREPVVYLIVRYKYIWPKL